MSDDKAKEVKAAYDSIIEKRSKELTELAEVIDDAAIANAKEQLRTAVTSNSYPE